MRPSRARHPLADASNDDSKTVPPPLPSTQDPFVLLGISRSAASDMSAIKSAYHRRIKAYHPDAAVTKSTPESVKKRINDDFSTIQAAYEALTSVRAASPESEPGTGGRPWWADQGAGARTAQGTGVGYGQPMGACFNTSFDEGKKPTGRRRKNTGKVSEGVVGFMEDGMPQPQTQTGEQLAPAAQNETSAKEETSAMDGKPQTQTPGEQLAPAAQNETSAKKGSTKKGSAKKGSAKRGSAKAPSPPAAVDEGQLAALEAQYEARCKSLEARYGKSLEENEARYEARCKALEGRLKRADFLAAALEERLKQAALLAEATKRENEMAEERLAMMASTHSQEKEQLEKKIKRLESELTESGKPWYQQSPKPWS